MKDEGKLFELQIHINENMNLYEAQDAIFNI